MPATRTHKPIPNGGYAPGSWHELQLLPNAPLDSNSAAKIANFIQDVNGWMSMPADTAGKGKQFSSCMIQTHNGDPVWSVSSYDYHSNVDNMVAPVWMSVDGAINGTPTSAGVYFPTNPANPVTYKGATLGSIHAPADLAKLIADGSDAPLQCRNSDTGEEFHSWITKVDTANRHISVGWGAYVPDVSKLPARFAFNLKLADGSMNGHHDMKVSASGIPMSCYTPTIDELIYGIHHPVGMAVPRLVQRHEDDPENPGQKRVKACYPACGSDGIVTEDDPNAANFLEMGQPLTLRPSSDYTKKHWPIWFRNLITAIQVYGLFPTDTNGPGSVTIAGISPNQYDEWLLGNSNPWESRILGDQSIQGNWCASYFAGTAHDENGNNYDGFPYGDLVALQVSRNATDYAQIAGAATLANWDIVGTLASMVPQTRGDLHAATDNARGIAMQALAAAKAGGGTGTGTASATTTVAPVAGGTLTLN